MTLNKVEIQSEQGQLLALTLGDVSSGFAVQSIRGLDPVPANVVSSGYAGLDGEQLQSVRREKRNLVFELGLETDYVIKSVQDLRNELYRFFLPKRSVKLRFFNDDFPTVDIVGISESFDCPLFVKDPKATISLVSLDPDFFEPVQVTVSGNTTAGSIMGTIDYKGTVDTGVVIRLTPNRVVNGFTVYHQTAVSQMQSMQVSGNFLAGDIIEISTVPGNKYATLTRGGVISSVLYAVSPYAVWTKLETGINKFRIHTEGVPVPFTLRYTNKHGGL